jgi:hypothetical protein
LRPWIPSPALGEKEKPKVWEIWVHALLCLALAMVTILSWAVSSSAKHRSRIRCSSFETLWLTIPTWILGFRVGNPFKQFRTQEHKTAFYLLDTWLNDLFTLLKWILIRLF